MPVLWYNNTNPLFYHTQVDLYRCLHLVDLIQLIFLENHFEKWVSLVHANINIV